MPLAAAAPERDRDHDDDLKRIDPEDMIGVFHRYQQEITENETKIMQLKIAKKYKGLESIYRAKSSLLINRFLEETIHKLMEDQTKLQDKSMKLRTVSVTSSSPVDEREPYLLRQRVRVKRCYHLSKKKLIVKRFQNQRFKWS
jgi:hypothetical protein